MENHQTDCTCRPQAVREASVSAECTLCVCVCVSVRFVHFKEQRAKQETDKCKKALSWRQRRQDSRIKDTDMFINTEEIC